MIIRIILSVLTLFAVIQFSGRFPHFLINIRLVTANDIFRSEVFLYRWKLRCSRHFVLSTVCLTWIKYPASITRVWNGSTVALQWDYNLTDREQTASQTAISLIWKRHNGSRLVKVAEDTFLSFSSPPTSIVEILKPHITISRSEKATLIINDVTEEDEGFYQIELILLTLGSFTTSRNTTLIVKGKTYVKKQHVSKNLLSLASSNRSVEIQQFTT